MVQGSQGGGPAWAVTPAAGSSGSPASGAMTLDVPVGERLVRMGALSPQALRDAMELREERGGRLTEILLREDRVDEKTLLEAMSIETGVPFSHQLDLDSIDPALVAPLQITWAKQYNVLPLEKKDDVVRVAVSDPLNLAPLDDLRVLYGTPVQPLLAPASVILAGINRVFDRLQNADQVAAEVGAEGGIDGLAHDLEIAKDILDTDDDAPIIRLVNSVLSQAVKERASDIHIEPFETDIVVRFRKDGILHEMVRAPRRIHASVSSRIKIMGNLNIAEKRLPQDGRIKIKIAGRDVDIRLSTVPTSFGERLVLRLLDKTATLLDLTDIGFSDENLRKMDGLIRRPHGIILVTGPTGSGKTTTLYSCLSRINSPDKNILTVEDPVEYQLPGIGQMQVNPKIDFTFSSGLRAILRQDPDVVLVGEIRDIETAEIAVQASLTGHLVFSTVHTNDSSSTFTRLIDMGVEPFLVASSVLAINAQRLVRRVCKKCREPYEPRPAELRQLGLQPDMLMGDTFQVYRAAGCEDCGMTGYAGRTGIYELMEVEDEIRQLVMRGVDAHSIKKEAIAKGLKTLRDDGAWKVLRGLTTIEEVMRVTAEDKV